MKVIRASQLKAGRRTMRTLHYGKGRTGKNHVFNSAPGLKGLIPCDPHGIPMLRKAIEDGAVDADQVLVPEKDLVLVTSGIGARAKTLAIMKKIPDERQKLYRDYVERVKDTISWMLDSRPRSIMIDGCTDLMDAINFAQFGRTEQIMPMARVQATVQLVEICKACIGTNLMATFQSKPVYTHDKPTGENTFRGPQEVTYLMSAIVEHVCPQTQAEADVFEELYGVAVKPGRFAMRISQCQGNPRIIMSKEAVLVGRECTYQGLALRVFPNSKESDWED